MTGRLARREPPIIVIGAGRSGTSLTAAILNVLGVDLGPKAGLIGADRHNAKGYWEQRDIHYLNHSILTATGGEYAIPPTLAGGWERAAELDPLRRRAEAALEPFVAGGLQWGIKDPILSLTLPLWHDLGPSRRYAICVRNPAEVAASWDRFSAGGGLDGRSWPAVWAWADLWFHYTANALVNTRGYDRALVFYEPYFDDLDAQLERLAALTGRRFTHACKRSAVEFVDRDLRHYRHDDDETPVVDPAVPEARLLYEALRAIGPDATESQIDRVERIAAELLVDRARRAPFDGPGEKARPEPAVVPSSIRVFPDDLAGARYYGVWTDGWLEQESSLSLAAGDGTRLQVRAHVPEAAGQQVTVSVDGAVVDSMTTGPGVLDVTLPIPASTGPRRVELRWARAVPLSQPDWRVAAALLELIALAPG